MSNDLRAVSGAWMYMQKANFRELKGIYIVYSLKKFAKLKKMVKALEISERL